jgi:hypothetical protein
MERRGRRRVRVARRLKERRRDCIQGRLMSCDGICNIRWRYLRGWIAIVAIWKSLHIIACFHFVMLVTSNTFTRSLEEIMPRHTTPSQIQRRFGNRSPTHFSHNPKNHHSSHDRTFTLLFMRRHAHLLKRLWPLTWLARRFRRRLCHSTRRLRRGCG